FAGDTKPLIDELSKAMPKSARAKLVVGEEEGEGRAPKTVELRLIGDSTQTLHDLANDIMPMLAARKELRDVRIDAGDKNSELQVRVDRERAAAFGFSSEQVSSFVGLA